MYDPCFSCYSWPDRPNLVTITHDSRLLWPFAQFPGTRFTGFALTPLTPPTRPSAAAHPTSANRAADMCWSRVLSQAIGRAATHARFSLVACCHPPVCCEFCFSIFFPSWLVLLSWAQSWVLKANWIPVAVVTIRASVAGTSLFCCPVIFLFNLYTFGTHVNATISEYGGIISGKEQINTFLPVSLVIIIIILWLFVCFCWTY